MALKLNELRGHLKARTEACDPVAWTELEARVDKTIELVRKWNTFAPTTCDYFA